MSSSASAAQPLTDFGLGFDFSQLNGGQVSAAIDLLSSMGFVCSDVSTEAVYTSIQPAGTYSCTRAESSGLSRRFLDIVLPFSENGIVLAVYRTDRSVGL